MTIARRAATRRDRAATRGGSATRRRARIRARAVPPDRQFDAFLARFDPRIAAEARRAIRAMRRRLPGAVELVYDNYNALVIGFGPSERASDAPFSLAIFPRWVTLCFLQGAGLDDPDHRRAGSGAVVRHIRLVPPEVFDDPAVQRLISAAIADLDVPFDRRAKRRMVIRSISKEQRSRR